jgi:hypothetical protein
MQTNEIATLLRLYFIHLYLCPSIIIYFVLLNII